MSEYVLQRVAAGDRGAVNECMNQFGGLVWSLAQRFSATRADAEDATQEIFIDVWKSAGRYDPTRGSESLFVATIARRRLIDRLRKRGRDPTADPVEYPGMQLPDGDSNRAEICAEAEQAAVAVAELKPAQQTVLELGLLRGLSHSEIATKTGMPLGTVKTQMRRGLIRLREMLEEDPESRASREAGS